MLRKKRSFAGKVALVTGAAGGLGRAMCHELGQAGASLGLMDLDGEGLKRLGDELVAKGVPSISLAGDIGDNSYCNAAVRQVVDYFGGLDVLVNNAGLTQRSAFADTEVAVFRQVMEVNFFGALYCTKAALPELLERQGQIVVISSIAGFSPLYGRCGYSASKHALHGLFDSLRSELFGTGVGVLIVCPGFIDTGFAHRALGGDGECTTHPRSTVGAMTTAEEVAQTIVRAARKNREMLVLSRVGHLTRFLTRVAPGTYQRLMARSLRHELER
ncbi:MAG: SDR family oxidoreductase [Proteobacteria bacterium]|jgi:NAD(P)-dependent dehydrogenase (short-subunit alcohol dehydrogenase family)|nr:SDR family oxidoreductase [Pseudomonadota bacterium]